MDKEQIKEIIDNPPQYVESQEDTILSWIKDAHSSRMRWVLIGVYAQYLIYLALAVFMQQKILLLFLQY